jgi:hypothetical protein
MTVRKVITAVLVVLCLTAVWATISQHEQLAGLRAEQQRLITESEQSSEISASSSTNSELPSPQAEVASVSPELLRLRGEVGVLRRRRRELEGIQEENQGLRLQLASRQTNNAPKLPPGYIRKREAKMVGYNTPEDTLQSFLWALAHREYQGLLDAFSPEAAQQFSANIPLAQASKLFQEMETVLPGLRVVDRKDLPDGAVELNVELIPGNGQANAFRALRFERLNGQWKLSSPNL